MNGFYILLKLYVQLSLQIYILVSPSGNGCFHLRLGHPALGVMYGNLSHVAMETTFSKPNNSKMRQ